MSINATGQGIIFDLSRELIDVLQPLLKIDNVEFSSCLPQPQMPDFNKYKTALFLIVLAWFILFVEPYALRLQHVIMEHFYPEIALHRCVWLYHEILRKRTNFITYARRQINVKASNYQDPTTCMQIFRSKIGRCVIFGSLWNI